MRKYVNRNWKFTYGNPEGAECVGYDDAAWYDIGLPHSMGTPYFMECEFYVGYGAYRKVLRIDENWIGKKLFLEFMGVFQVAEVYVNGNKAGEHRGGYTPFIVDISEYVNSGDNLLYVRVNNEWDGTLAPRAGEHVFNAGIYRDVSLIVEDPVHITWYGTAVTSRLEEEAAQVRIETEIINESDIEQKWHLVNVIQSPETYLQFAAETPLTGILAPGEIRKVEQWISVSDAQLWSPETPYLYTVNSLLTTDGGMEDQTVTTFGIRTVEFTADRGFFLNGKHYKPLGANVHQDHAGWSDAVTRAGIQRDISLIKECGMNFIRGSHYPHHPYFAEECDRQGLLFWSELCFWGTGGEDRDGFWCASGYPVVEEEQEAFEESCFRAMEEMIRVHRNHPSIVVWSTGNEVFFSEMQVMEKARVLTRKLVEYAHQLDPTRPVAVGGAQRGGFDVLGDVAGYNGDGASLFIDPGFPSFVSEYGSYISKRPGVFAPQYTDNTDQDFPWRSGKALWCGFHHGSIFEGMGYMGMIDYYRLPLKTWYWYRQELLGIAPEENSEDAIPVRLAVTVDREQIQTDGTDDVFIKVQALTASGKRSSHSLEVKLESVEGGLFFPTGRSMVLSEANDGFMDGQGAIEARSWYSGPCKVRVSAEGLEEVLVEVEAVGPVAWDSQMQHWMEGVPGRKGVPAPESTYNTALNRPVFCSSQDPKHPARCVANGIGFLPWKPLENDDAPWVMVDLEGPRALSKIRVIPTDQAADYEVTISEDGNAFVSYGRCRELVPEMPVRYVRVSLKNAEYGIAAIDCIL